MKNISFIQVHIYICIYISDYKTQHNVLRLQLRFSQSMQYHYYIFRALMDHKNVRNVCE